MENQVELAKLFFELASDSRLSILRALSGESLKMQEVARRLDVTATEAFRQLERLSSALLVQRLPEGTYTITHFGKLLMQLSCPLGFLLKYKEYFMTHDITPLPHQFVNRLGELSETTLVSDTMESLNRAQRMFIETKEFGWGLAEGVVPELMGPIMADHMRQGRKFKFIVPQAKMPAGPADLPGMEIRSLSQVPAVVAITEKEAAFCLRTFDGKMDYSAFYGCDPVFLGWAKDLFNYFWEKGKRL